MLRELKYAEVLAEHRSFRGAAYALGISQSQLSRVIQSLERELGIVLFERDRQGVALTPDGAQVLDEVSTLLRAEQAFSARVTALRNRTADGLRLGVGAVVAQTWLTAAVASFARKQPVASMSIRELDWWKIGEAVLGDEFDLVIGESTGTERDVEIVVERFPQRGAAFVVRAGHPLDGRKEMTIADIAEFPLAAPRLPGRIGQFFPQSSKLGHVSGDGAFYLPMIETSAPHAILDVVQGSDAVGMSIRPLCDDAVAAGIIVELPLHPPWLFTRQAILHARGRRLTPAARLFRTAAKVAEGRYFAAAPVS